MVPRKPTKCLRVLSLTSRTTVPPAGRLHAAPRVVAESLHVRVGLHQTQAPAGVCADERKISVNLVKLQTNQAIDN
jgi:hypothetical protein